MENKMEEVAKLLGVELEEEFRLEDLSSKYKLTETGLRCWSNDSQQWYTSRWLEELLTGEMKIIKIPKKILNEEEKEYLANVIKPFKDKVVSIAKNYGYGNFIQITLALNDFENGFIDLPFFKNEMYQGMKVGKRYTLKELGL